MMKALHHCLANAMCMTLHDMQVSCFVVKMACQRKDASFIV